MSDSDQQGASADSFDADGTLVGNEQLRAAAAAGIVELALRLPDGQTWSLTFSAGIERFIGSYPRLPGLDPRGAGLVFRTVWV